MFSGGTGAGGGVGVGGNAEETERTSPWAGGRVKSCGSTVQAKGPAWYLQAIR